MGMKLVIDTQLEWGQWGHMSVIVPQIFGNSTIYSTDSSDWYKKMEVLFWQ